MFANSLEIEISSIDAIGPLPRGEKYSILNTHTGNFEGAIGG